MTAVWLRYSSNNGFRSSSFKAGLLDHEQTLWLTSGYGVEKWTMRNLAVFPFHMGHVYNNGAVTVDSGGHFWAASQAGLQELWTNSVGEWRTETHRLPVGRYVLTPQAVNIDFRGRLWVNFTDVGLRCYSITPGGRGASRLVDTTPPRLSALLPEGAIQCFIVDRKNRLWCSVHAVGVIVIDLNRGPTLQRTFSNITGLDGGNSVRVLFEDLDGRIWIAGFNGGVAVISPDDIQGPPTILETKGLPAGGVRALLQDSEGRMWIGTRYGGLALLENGG
ncbi:MAG: hybrid sensor histidine kinase/response regulator, partial [Bacteroidetes bacterium]|nr:hybrid sensor histidine kinase/response regulator [Bacteroidota bacterium]